MKVSLFVGSVELEIDRWGVLAPKTEQTEKLSEIDKLATWEEKYEHNDRALGNSNHIRYAPIEILRL